MDLHTTWRRRHEVWETRTYGPIQFYARTAGLQYPYTIRGVQACLPIQLPPPCTAAAPSKPSRSSALDCVHWQPISCQGIDSMVGPRAKSAYASCFWALPSSSPATAASDRVTKRQRGTAWHAQQSEQPQGDHIGQVGPLSSHSGQGGAS